MITAPHRTNIHDGKGTRASPTGTFGAITTPGIAKAAKAHRWSTQGTHTSSSVSKDMANRKNKG
eukprot:12912547-Alexandrium_andersonii.AAC.1